MYKYAVIENEKIVNIVLSEQSYAAEQGWIVCSDEAGIDWDYINGQFVDNRPQPQAPAAPTKEELLAKLQELQAQIQALG